MSKPYTLAEFLKDTGHDPAHYLGDADPERIGLALLAADQMREEMEEQAIELADTERRLEEFKRNAAAAIDELTKECAARRDLIKRAEYANHAHSADACPWCGAEAIGQRWSGLDDPPHKADCPAFFPNGIAR